MSEVRRALIRRAVVIAAWAAMTSCNAEGPRLANDAGDVPSADGEPDDASWDDATGDVSDDGEPDDAVGTGPWRFEDLDRPDRVLVEGPEVWGDPRLAWNGSVAALIYTGTQGMYFMPLDARGRPVGSAVPVVLTPGMFPVGRHRISPTGDGLPFVALVEQQMETWSEWRLLLLSDSGTRLRDINITDDVNGTGVAYLFDSPPLATAGRAYFGGWTVFLPEGRFETWLYRRSVDELRDEGGVLIESYSVAPGVVPWLAPSPGTTNLLLVDESGVPGELRARQFDADMRATDSPAFVMAVGERTASLSACANDTDWFVFATDGGTGPGAGVLRAFVSGASYACPYQKLCRGVMTRVIVVSDAVVEDAIDSLPDERPATSAA
jgi:hypothetical protein